MIYYWREFWGVAPPPLPWLQGYVNKKYRETPRQVWGVAHGWNVLKEREQTEHKMDIVGAFFDSFLDTM